jgi:sialate O-acetylesterase
MAKLIQLQVGLFDHMVLQRNPRNLSQARFAGQCAVSGPVLATVRHRKTVVHGFARLPVGVAARGRLSGCLAGLPVGGPYELTLTVGEATCVVRDLLVGDVWLLGGQSNMQGCGLLPRQRLGVDPQVRAFYMDDRWDVARDPVHNMWSCVDNVHVALSGGRPVKPTADFGVSPGPAFAVEMRRLTGVPQGMIACAHGGTTMTQWDPQRRDEQGQSLYGAMVRRLRKNGGRVAGLLWYQGESEARVADAPLYTERMQQLVAALRRDAKDRKLPVAMVQISRVTGAWWGEPATAWNAIQEQQRLLPAAIRNLTLVPAIDLSLDDGIHIAGKSHYVLGKRLAQAMQVLRAGRRAGLPPITLKGITVEKSRGMAVVVAEFAHVAGRLRAGSRPSGFVLVTDKGVMQPFDVVLDGERVRIRCEVTTADVATAALHYGYGLAPYCNIVDEDARSLPVFGPVAVGKPRALTPPIQQLRVSAFQSAAGKLDTLACPARLESLGMASRTFTEPFCNLHPEIAQLGGQDAVVYYACRFTCAEAMRLAVILGYDGPVKLWVDGKLRLHVPLGTNPAEADKNSVPFAAAAGKHELIVALGTNHGAAWGIFLRLERIGLSRSAQAKGVSQVRLPEILG